MKKIVLNKPVIETIDFATAMSPENLRNKIIVQVYDKQASILTETRPVEGNHSFAFTEISKGISVDGHTSMNLRTDGISHLDAFNNLKIRLLEVLERGANAVMDYYIFDSLGDFARAVIENDWK